MLDERGMVMTMGTVAEGTAMMVPFSSMMSMDWMLEKDGTFAAFVTCVYGFAFCD